MSIKIMLSFAGLLAAGPLMAQSLSVSAGNSVPVATSNDFRTVPNGLNARGLLFYSTNRTITLTQTSILSFFFLGSESGYQNRFTSGTITWVESDGLGSRFAVPLSQGSYTLGPGTYRPYFNTPSGGVTTAPSYPGDTGFGIFLPANSAAGFTASSLVFGYDDPTSSNPANLDRDYDDFMLQVVATSAAPEPAAWAMMLAGFGLSGWALRRRPRSIAGTAAGR